MNCWKSCQERWGMEKIDGVWLFKSGILKPDMKVEYAKVENHIVENQEKKNKNKNKL